MFSMMKKRLLFSEGGMRIVNFLFFLSLLFRNSGVVFFSYTLWAVYLACCIRRASSKAAQVAYTVLLAFAAGMILLNFYYMVQSNMV